MSDEKKRVYESKHTQWHSFVNEIKEIKMRGWSLRNQKTNGWWVKKMWYEKKGLKEMGKLKDWVEIGLRFEGSNGFVVGEGFVGVV